MAEGAMDDGRLFPGRRRGGTLSDLERLARALLEGRAPGQESLHPIEGVATGGLERRTGTLWVIDPAPNQAATVVWHNGTTGGYSSLLLLVPEAGRAVAVLANNARPRQVQPIAQAVAAGLPRWAARPSEL